MLSRLYLISACVLVTLLLCGHFAVNAFFKAEQLKAQAENITVRTRLMKHQIGAMEQKVRVLRRVEHFLDRAKAMRLEPQGWAAYDVHIQDTMTYAQLSQVIEQCVHNKDIYFKPKSFHIAVNTGEPTDSKVVSGAEPVPLNADTLDSDPSDVSLALQGTFMVRH